MSEKKDKVPVEQMLLIAIGSLTQAVQSLDEQIMWLRGDVSGLSGQLSVAANAKIRTRLRDLEADFV